MITTILLAAGKGERSGLAKNKAFSVLNGLPVICHSLSVLSPLSGEVLLAVRKEDEEEAKRLLTPYPNARTVTGGKTRAESVLFALREAAGDSVLIHDAARPYLNERIVKDCIESIERCGSGITAIPSTDTVALSSDGITMERTLARADVYAVQTPQGFKKEEILFAYEKAFEEGKGNDFTDDSGVYLAYFKKSPALVQVERANRKLTYAEDFSPARVGFGVDTHRFENKEEGLPFLGHITLGGVHVPSERRLVAHSDGDVLVHALMDALLSAAGLRDIGYYFPDTDEAFAGADSMELLEKTLSLVKEAGFAPKNASLTILAETPRLAPYIEAMKETLATALALPPSALGIAAGTNETLGYVGEGRGITCCAYVSLNDIAKE